MSLHIAVDIGGTQIRAACYPLDSLTPVCVDRTSTQGGGQDPISRLLSLIESVWPEDGEVAGIGVAAPGPLDPFRGIIFSAPNIPGWKDVPLRQILQERFSVPVALGNDANLAALGEWQYGAGQGHHHLIYLTVSTGIGGGVIVNDDLLLGAHGLGAELGHVTILADGPRCGCGVRGHLEALSSGTAIARWTKEQLESGVESILDGDSIISAKIVAEAARSGDALAIEAYRRAGYYLGIALADYLHIFNPTAIIFGGGVSKAGPLLFEPARAAMKEHLQTSQYLDDLVITSAALGDETGLIGALALARRLTQSSVAHTVETE